MALTAPTTYAREAQWKPGDVVAFLMTASQTIYKGDIVITAGSTGLVRSLYETGAHGDSFVGVALETVTSAASGSSWIKCALKGVFKFQTVDAPEQIDVGQLALGDVVGGNPGPRCVTHEVAEYTVAHGPLIGKIVKVDIAASEVWVDICPIQSKPIVA